MCHDFYRLPLLHIILQTDMKAQEDDQLSECKQDCSGRPEDVVEIMESDLNSCLWSLNLSLQSHSTLVQVTRHGKDLFSMFHLQKSLSEC